MSAVLLLFVMNPQQALQTPQGLRYGYEPFYASHWWLADNAQHKQRVVTADEYRSRVLRSGPPELKQRCGERGLTAGASRDATIALLLAAYEGLVAPDHLDVATWAELVQECRLLGLNAAGSEADLRVRIRAADGATQEEDQVAAGGGKSEPTPDTVAPAPLAAPLVSKISEQDAAQLARLKAALAAGDYNGIRSVATSLTSERPPTRSKSEVIRWAQALVTELEG